MFCGFRSLCEMLAWNGSKTVEDLQRPIQHPLEGERRPRADAVEDLRQVVAVNELHLNHEELADVVETVNANDVRVVDVPDDVRLLAK